MNGELHHSIKKKLNILSDLYGFSIHVNQTSIKIEFNGFVGIQLVIACNDDNVDFRFWVRTSSWYYIDERTDIHDTISLLFAVLLRSKAIASSSIIHGYNDFGNPDVEIYSSFSLTAQSNFVVYKKDDFIHSLIDSALLFQVWFSNSFGCPCEECNADNSLRIGKTVEISRSFKSSVFAALGESSNINFKKRFYPYWEYFRDFDKKITIIKDKKVAQFVYNLSEESGGSKLKSVNGQLIRVNNLCNYISSSTIRRANKIINGLKNGKKIITRFIILENVAIFSTPDFIVSITGRFGLFEYKREKDKLRERHMCEFALLFSPTNLKWKDQVKPDRFENLVKDLLERDSSIEWVRKFAHTNESDGGRDLICRKSIPNSIPDENAPTNRTIDVIVQCKFYKDGVSKDKVLDIRDTIEHNNYGGYLLIVSSYTKKSLTEHLDVLRKKGTLWIDWWTQDEIFDRIKLYPELIGKYSDLLITQD